MSKNNHKYIRWFKDLNIKDIPTVGGKNASLGEMYSKLTKKGIKIPNGFALTADAYWRFLKDNNLDKNIRATLKNLDVKNVRALSKAGKAVREMILNADFPKDIKKEVLEAHKKLLGKKDISVAVRSSATAEDLPDASFAGQQETYLNVKGERELLLAVKKCLASLFTDRAISYRQAKDFDHMAVALSVCVQEMVRSDIGTSGVMFTLDTESGFKGVVLINAAYGLGEYVVKGQVVPDQFFIFKEGLKKGKQSIISKRLGTKEVKLIYGESGTHQVKVPAGERQTFCISDEEVMKLSKWGMMIEDHYGHPMDIEWAKDGGTGELFIVQARSETVKSRAKVSAIETYKLGKKGQVIVEGKSIGQKIGQGKARIINSAKQMKYFKQGEVLVTRITDPDWEPIMRIASAVITEQGGKTSHAAIVSRELGIPCLVGATRARQLIKQGEEVTVSCAEGEQGFVYKGRLPFTVEHTEIKQVPDTKTKIMMNIGDPDSAFTLSAIPSDGVGLAREEFIFTNFIKIHPLALINYKNIHGDVRKKIDSLTVGYKDKAQFGVDRLAEGIAFIASAFYPYDVIVRLSDFKTNEYATLIGGKDYEPKEENPMLGWRGASRYYDPKYKAGFELECKAMKKVREEWGLNNVIIMVPFCRTVEEGKKVLAVMKEFGLERGKDGLKVYVMCEIPSNVILADQFSQIFDGFSIGSNDLTQLTLGVDRDSALVSHVYDENNLAVKKLIRDVIQTAHKNKCKVGICGQAPSDYPKFAEFLVQEGIDSISLNPDTVLKTRTTIADMEKKLGGGVSSLNKKISVSAGKALMVLGVLGLALTLGGYTCQSFDKDQKNIQAFNANEIDLIKNQARQEAEKKIEEKMAEIMNQKIDYTEDNFVRFEILLPYGWQVSHCAPGCLVREEINFDSNNHGEWFHIWVDKNGAITGATTTWNGYKARFYNNETDGDMVNRAQPYKAIELSPKRDKSYTIHIAGDAKNFDEFIGSMKNFEIIGPRY